MTHEPAPWFRPNGLADLSLESAVRRHLAFVMDYAGGDTLWAAQELGVHRTTLARWQNGRTQVHFRPGIVRRSA